MPTGKGLGHALREGKQIGCTAVQVFTSSPRMWKSSAPSQEKIDDIAAAIEETGLRQLASHDTYLVNLCNPDETIAQKSFDTLRDEMDRCGKLGIPLVVSHMGALMGQPLEQGLRKVADRAKEILAETPSSVRLLMETTAGQGSAINSKFEEIATILELAGGDARLAVCLDTCHVFVAGYELRTKEGYAETFRAFDKTIGLDRLKLLHINDSKKDLGSRVDRHENIGKGCLGLEPFRMLVNDPRFENVPMVIETPTENEGHETDLKALWGLAGKSP